MSPFFYFPEVFSEKNVRGEGDTLVFYFPKVFSEKMGSARKNAPAFCFPEVFSEKKCARANIFPSCGKDEKKNVSGAA